jgi:hypothetical protein
VQRLHSHSFYLFGVVVGLSIREALVRTGSDLFLPTKVEIWKVHLEALRLIIFLLTITCFYFGAGVFFDKIYINPETATRYQRKNYGLDFSFGLIHFLAFFAWALSINDYSRSPKWGVSPFLGFLSAIFLYDLAWLFISYRYDSFDEIKLWAEWCAGTFFLASFVFIVVKFLFSKDDVFAEEMSFLVYGLYIAGDITELFSGRPFFEELLKKLLPKRP